jgi:hypothetical protein
MKVSNLELQSTLKRQAIARWKSGIVYYKIEQADFTSDEISLIERAMKHIEDRTADCVRFNATQNVLQKHVLVRKMSICQSTVGRAVDKQKKLLQKLIIFLQINNLTFQSDIILNELCLSEMGHVVHELMHTLGFTHEHQRPDRDRYVNVDMSNVDRHQVDTLVIL